MTKAQKRKWAAILNDLLEPDEYLEGMGKKKFVKKLGSARLAELVREAGVELTPEQLEQLKGQLDKKTN